MNKLEFYQQLERYFQDSLQESASAAEGFVEVSIRKQDGTIPKVMGREFLMLTVCSYTFRIILSIYFNRNTRTEEYVIRQLGVNIENLNDASFYDVIGEYSNVFTGEFKRKLGTVVPCLGMSTPVRLSSECNQYPDIIKDGHISYAEVKIDGELLFEAVMLVEASDESEEFLDSKLANVVEDESSSGELEFF